MISRSELPQTHYARSSGYDIAYQVYGEGDVTLVGTPGIVSNIEVMWEDPDSARFLRRIGTFARAIHYDKRGQGLSDRLAGIPTLEERVDDLRAVIDAVGADTVALGGVSEGGLMSAFFAATHPERVSALELFGSAARFVATDDYPIGLAAADAEAGIAAWEAAWGSSESMSVGLVAASKVGDASFAAWMSRFERSCSTPTAFGATARLDMGLDIRGLLGAIRAPTLVMHRRDDPLTPVAHGRYLAEHIPGARYIEFEGADHAPWYGDQDAVLDELEEFLTGHKGAGDAHRVLSSVLFTDIVASTERATGLGDRRWREVLDDLDALVVRHVGAAGGRVVKGTGDGHLATFDGPARAVRAAQAITSGARALGIELRAGLHTGEIEVRGDDIGGIAVHTAARVSSIAAPNQVLVSRTVTDLVAGSGLRFVDAGSHDLKGVTGQWQLFEALIGSPASG